ncbi:LOXL2 [Symbiodinium pilosum]|uniref:LOXL2 protein n=1 Tax=Symbiodinium pilosum TaxID=2952 RepID=A0A812TCW7_SYMPI|nr:LOXL2 [Symbiodinium pilosum]
MPNLAGPAVRLIDETGSHSSSGLVEVQTANGHGTVCGLDQGAADTICRLMGFQEGSVVKGACSSIHGHNLCGSRGMPVAMQQLSCKGTEQNLAQCQWVVPRGECLEHFHDSVVECHGGSASSSFRTALRLVDAQGRPSQSSSGRLEVLLQGHGWSPVCSSGFGIGSAAAACKSLGFAAVDGNPVHSCNEDEDICGTALPQVQLLCDGTEPDVSKCSQKVGDEVFCAPHENDVARARTPLCTGRHRLQHWLQSTC